MRYALNNCEQKASGDQIVFHGLSTAGREFSVTVKSEDLDKYMNGALIQEAFPYLSADERELCMSGIDSSTWNSMFKEEDDE